MEKMKKKYLMNEKTPVSPTNMNLSPRTRNHALIHNKTSPT